MKRITILPVLAALSFAAPALADSPAPPPDVAAKIAAHHADQCADRYAHVVGKLAEIETRLSLTEAQKAAWERFKDIKLKHAKAASAECVDFKPLGPDASIIDRRKLQIARLEKRLANLKAETPALEALVKVLTPEQQAILKHAAREEMGRRMMMMHRFEQFRGPMQNFGRHAQGDHPTEP